MERAHRQPMFLEGTMESIIIIIIINTVSYIHCCANANPFCEPLLIAFGTTYITIILKLLRNSKLLFPFPNDLRPSSRGRHSDVDCNYTPQRHQPTNPSLTLSHSSFLQYTRVSVPCVCYDYRLLSIIID